MSYVLFCQATDSAIRLQDNTLEDIMKVPLLATAEVFHFGTLDPAQQPVAHGSLEGHCLSVSHCPEAWRRIARLGGTQLFSLRKPGARFVDVLKVYRTATLRKRIEVWAIEQGLAEWKTLYRAWVQVEDASWAFMLAATPEQALAECSWDAEATQEEVEGPNGPGTAIEPVTVLAGTAKLARRVRHYDLTVRDAFDYAMLCWIEDCLPDVDGAWWREAYDPAAYSAPRGGILPSRLAQWAVAAAPSLPVDDGDSTQLTRASMVI